MYYTSTAPFGNKMRTLYVTECKGVDRTLLDPRRATATHLTPRKRSWNMCNPRSGSDNQMVDPTFTS